MRTSSQHGVVGHIRSRLLVNALVDSQEAARFLPAGLRPHVVDGGTVVGICLLDIGGLRPACLPRVPGAHVRAAAHRISAEWDGAAGTTVGVYVPARLTGSRAARAIGGRSFPGVHRAAVTELVDDGHRLSWSVHPKSSSDYRVHVTAHALGAPGEPCESVGATCLGATVGVSPGHDGALETARMEAQHRCASVVAIDELESTFLDSFSSATPAPSYVVRDVDVRWHR